MSGLLCGSLGASRIADATAKTKSGWGASRANVMAEIIVERMTGQPYQTYSNAAMQWGIEQEPVARAAYEFKTGNKVIPVEAVSVLHPAIVGTHASPDGFVGDKGLIEIKCPQSATHMVTLDACCADSKYEKQMQWQMACTGREWCDWVSYDPRWPLKYQLFHCRVERDDKMIASLEKDVREFLAELESKLAALRSRYDLPTVLKESAA